MKIAIVGGGNMGGAIAEGLSTGAFFSPQDITVITKSRRRDYGKGIQSVVADYTAIEHSDVVVLAVKPWLCLEFVESFREQLFNPDKILISVAAGIELCEYVKILGEKKAVFRAMPNTAISQRQSMTFISSVNASEEQNRMVVSMFGELGKAELIDEKLFSAGTAISGCGIAYAFRYIRAAMEGGVEMGLSSQQSLEAVLQTLKGAVDLLEANQTHPEQEIDKVTTPGGLTIKGLNEMEHAGFSSAVIKGLKASQSK